VTHLPVRPLRCLFAPPQFTEGTSVFRVHPTQLRLHLNELFLQFKVTHLSDDDAGGYLPARLYLQTERPGQVFGEDLPRMVGRYFQKGTEICRIAALINCWCAFKCQSTRLAMWELAIPFASRYALILTGSSKASFPKSVQKASRTSTNK
jgi:hypothetical protein